MFRRNWLPALVLSAVLTAGSLSAAERRPEVFTFGTLKAVSMESARTQAEQWLASTGRADEATRKQFEAIWANKDLSVTDQITETLSLDPAAAKVLNDVRSPAADAPKAVPELVKNKATPKFLRANLAVSFAKAISSKRVYEEALEALSLVKAEDVADPAAYLFHKAVAEHALMKKDEASQSIVRLIDDVADAPERYKMVAALMLFDMQGWKKDEKDLSNIAKLMDNSGRRLDLSRGGKITQEIQKKIVFRLDEVIKEAENQCKGNCSGNGGNCPGGQPGNGQQPGNTNQPSSPQTDSIGGTNSGPGKIDERKLQQLAEIWGKLPEKERARAMMELTRDLPPRYREIIENYAKSIARGTTAK